MVFRGQIIAKIVDQRGHHQLDVSAIRLGPCRRLQRMLKPVDPVAGKRASQPFQRGQQPVGQCGDIVMLQPSEEGVILWRAFIHAGEADGPGSGRSPRPPRAYAVLVCVYPQRRVATGGRSASTRLSACFGSADLSPCTGQNAVADRCLSWTVTGRRSAVMGRGCRCGAGNIRPARRDSLTGRSGRQAPPGAERPCA